VRRPSTAAPRIDPIALPELDDNSGGLLGAGDNRDAERYDGVDLAEHDLTGITFTECEFHGVDFDQAKLRGASFLECIASDLHAPVFSAPASTWRDVHIGQSRLGSVELYDANFRSVRIEGSKLDFVNLRNATLTDVLLTNCIIGELDLGGATVHRLHLQDCRIGTLDVTHARLTDADLRSSDYGAIHGIDGLRAAIIDDAQLALLAPLLAAHLGIRVE